jgi:hypothetical protein
MIQYIQYQTVLISNRIKNEQKKINSIIVILVWSKAGFLE